MISAVALRFSIARKWSGGAGIGPPSEDRLISRSTIELPPHLSCCRARALSQPAQCPRLCRIQETVIGFGLSHFTQTDVQHSQGDRTNFFKIVHGFIAVLSLFRMGFGWLC